VKSAKLWPAEDIVIKRSQLSMKMLSANINNQCQCNGEYAEIVTMAGVSMAMK
jgi:hypothetical protein